MEEAGRGENAKNGGGWEEAHTGGEAQISGYEEKERKGEREETARKEGGDLKAIRGERSGNE